MGLRGPKKGARYAPTIAKEQAREAVRAVVNRHMDRMLRSQIQNAIGIGHMYTRDKAGKFNKIESEAEVDRLFNEGVGGQDYWIFTKDPSTQAFVALMDRALDKPKEQEQSISLTVTGLDERIKNARKRASGS